MEFGIREEIWKKIKEVIQKYHYEFKIFGSRARGDYRKNSDIDIAILGNVSEEDEMKIKNDLDEIDMEYMLDIVLVEQLKNENLRKNIEREGVLI